MTQRDDFEVEEALPIAPARAAQILLYIIAGLFFATLLWAATAKIDRVTRGEGRVVPSNQLQEVQYLEGGIVKEILVAAGDAVKAGQTLIRLDPTQFNAEFLKGREGYHALAARVRRLEAEAVGAPFVIPPDIARAAPEIAADERALYEARQAERAAALEVEESKLAQREQALEDAKVAEKYAREALKLAAEEAQMMDALVEKGIEPQMERLRARQREATARSELKRAEIAVERAALEVDEARNEILRIESAFSASAADELAKAKAELAELSGGLPALEDRVTRTEVKAPIDGIVNRVLVSTIGGVVQPGQTIVEIVPSEDTLLVEARIKPADIGFLRVGQEARVRLTAYDSSRYGALKGRIEHISPDAIADEEKRERYYLIKVRTDSNVMTTRDGELKILPGMAAEVDVLNGKRTVLAYLLKPIAEVGGKALREQ
ncbi:MAG: HlyD family type I secretion periplasmic adaptor subunit [Amphiplicatus sp.]